MNKEIRDYSVSKKYFELKYDSKLELYQTLFNDWKNLDAYYRSENYISHTDGKRNWFEKIYQIIKKYTIKRKWKLISKFHSKSKLNILDIGCGTGDFLKYGIESKKNIGLGVEPNTKSRELAQKKNLEVYSTIESIDIGKTFDLITLWHVLEHVKDLNEYFMFFKSKLNKDGLLFIAVPNFKSFDANYYKEYWAAWDVPRHIWHFSKTSIQKLIKPYGFELIHIEPMYFDSYYVSFLSEEYKTGRKKILKSTLIGFLSNFKARSTKEYSSHIYIFKKRS